MSSDGTIIEGKTRTIKNYQKYEGLSEKTDIYWLLTRWIGRSISKNASISSSIQYSLAYSWEVITVSSRPKVRCKFAKL
jgi:hypothetical protein